MNNYQTWLETPNIVRIALVQVQALVANTLTTRYLSTHGVTVDGIQYLPIVRGSITVDESISTSYSASISYGDIELANNNGEYDSWLNDVWVNKSVKIYVGSQPAPGTSSVLNDYELIFDGIIYDIDSKSRTQLNLKIRDKLEKLNTSISETLLGNYHQGSVLADNDLVQNQYKNNLKPLVFGEVHNITPLLTDPAMLEYMTNATAVEQIIEVRDNGVPVAFTTTGTIPIPAGSFRLVSGAPRGTLTCSVQGIKQTVNIAAGTTSATYTNTASNTIATILKLYGQQLAYTEIDTASFGVLGTEAVGVYVSDRVNVLTLCQELAKNCGLVLTTTRSGKVKLVDLTIPTSASTTITDSDILLNSLQLTEKLDVIAGVKLGYAKNWTIQNNLLTGIPEEHKSLYATEWLESSQTDATVKAAYGVTTEPALEPSYLIDKTQADAVAQKKLTLFKTSREIFTMTCVAKLLSVQVGDPVTLTSQRFGLNSGALGRVVSTKPNWLRGTIEIGVLV
jgi:hypothetical protein